MMTADSELLRRFVDGKSQDAFAELVQRHLDLVYSAALRQVRSPQLAEEISQSVFTDLARAAGELKPDTILTAWLYQVARRTAIDVIRRESRRQARERLAAEMAAMNTASDWTQIEPLLDEAMDALDETDRAAVLLRYFDNKSLREVGQSLGTSDDAAQKRVSRAVERLRDFFSKRGVAIGATGLVVIISSNAVHAAPIGMAVTISTAALAAATAIQTSTAIAATKAIAMTTLQRVLVTTSVAVLVGVGVYEAGHASQSRDQAETFQPQQRSSTEQVAQLQRASAPPAVQGQPAVSPLPIQPPQPPVDNFLTFDSQQKDVSVTNGTPQARFTFNVTNISSGEVIISFVQSSCGCTVAKLPSTPWKLASKEGGQISATMNLAGTPPGGSKTKTLTVITDKGNKALYVKATISSDAPAIRSSLTLGHQLVATAAKPNNP